MTGGAGSFFLFIFYFFLFPFLSLFLSCFSFFYLAPDRAMALELRATALGG